MAQKEKLAQESVPLAERSETELTPLQKQYYEIKRTHSKYLLFFRLGDFYELFDEDAKVASRELDLMLTTRDRNKPAAEQMPMCGVPYHSADSYIAKLLQKGYKIAVCEQMEDPATAKGLVKREVVRIITPGTVTDEAMLDKSRSNYLCAVCAGDEGAAAAFCDISTGEFAAVEYGRPGHKPPDERAGLLRPARGRPEPGRREEGAAGGFPAPPPRLLAGAGRRRVF